MPRLISRTAAAVRIDRQKDSNILDCSRIGRRIEAGSEQRQGSQLPSHRVATGRVLTPTLQQQQQLRRKEAESRTKAGWGVIQRSCRPEIRAS